MKYKVKYDADKEALKHLKMGKHDWFIWSGEEKEQCVQIGGLIRMVYTDRPHANCIDSKKRYLRSEQLTFQSRKAAARWIRKHKNFIIEDYQKKNRYRIPHVVMATQWLGSGVFYMSI